MGTLVSKFPLLMSIDAPIKLDIGLKNLDIINKIIDINKKTKIDYNNELTRKSRNFYSRGLYGCNKFA